MQMRQLTSSVTGPDDGVATPMPFGGSPMLHLLNFSRSARSGARGVRHQDENNAYDRGWPVISPILLDALQNEYQIGYSIIADSMGNILQERGAKECIENSGLFNMLVGTPECIRNLYQSIEGQMLPRVWGQGNDVCYVCRPRIDLMVLLFGKVQETPTQEYVFSKEINQKVCAAMANGINDA
jgi:hypothetical protein